MSTIAAPSVFNPSRLNPHHSLRPDTRTHLSNLDRLLIKNPIPPQQQQQQQQQQQHRATQPNNQEERRFYQNLNLNPFRTRTAETMSPRSLARLQRLLSSPRLSPKNSIAATWQHLHGSNHWAGLLDPLDDNLRRELTRYGDLVQSAYHAFHSNPSVSPSSRNREVILPDRSYRVTKSLFATSSIDLPSFVSGFAPWMTQRSSWFGYVAVCDNDREISRMGRRDIVIALRGTATALEWAENFRAGLVSIDDDDANSKVANGFLSLYKSAAGPNDASLSTMIREEILRLTQLYKGEELSITITGHSLGGAIALLVADELKTDINLPTSVFSFGGPKVGNRAFAERIHNKGVKVLRVVNSNDVVTRVPGVIPKENDGYVHVGTELRVDSKSSPYLKPDADPNCCHDLESYLHLVDGFIGTDCPFRADAKRSLVRLFELQRPNLKKLCVSQARAMGLDRVENVGSAAAALASPSTVGYLASPSGYR